jgi:peptidyl-prolyl cis-trans isomerase B (cyclophilin B)
LQEEERPVRNQRIILSTIGLLVLLAGLYALNWYSERPKPPPDVQLEGRLAPPPPEPTVNAEAPEATVNAEGKGEGAQTQPNNAAKADLSNEEQQLVAKAKGSVVKLETEKGNIYLELYDDKTPITVGNFLDLVGSGFYDGLTFHRVIANFMIQGGDPKGDGTGGPGFTIPDEADKGLKHVRGSLSMAKTAAPNTGGSQFFICHSPQPHLDGVHTVFGECIQGMDVVDKIAVGDKIKKATILKKSSLADEDIKKAKAARVPNKG